MSFKITITNNDDGEVIVNEENAVAIIGAVTTNEHTACLAYTKCNLIDLFNAIIGTDKAKESILADKPMLKVLFAAQKLKKDED